MMNSELSPEFVEKYQTILKQDPKSKVFAPLAEAYRKMNWLDHAEKIGREGVKHNPNFPSGRVVLAKIMLDRRNLEEAVEQLKTASDLSPENILAHRLLAQSLLELKRPKEALKAFKMVLFLNPNDQNAIKTVSRLESLTADEYDDELFEMKPLSRAVIMMEQKRPVAHAEATTDEVTQTQSLPKMQRTLERAISLADAFVARNDFDKALQTIDQAEEQIGANPELTKRRRFLTSRNQTLVEESPTSIKPLLQDVSADKDRRLLTLKGMLQRVVDRRVEP